MNLLPSESEQEGSFQLLHPEIQRWIWERNWSELRDAQARAIPILLEATGDLIISASTAAGKTEAAFLPILTSLVRRTPTGLAIYVSPLKALINDQWSRLDDLCERMRVPVVPWHGDISASRKAKFARDPSGCLLITPESLEGILMRHGTQLPHLFQRLEFVVVDELHAFFGTERGRQLQSLLARVEAAIGRTIRRVGLSATLGNMDGARHYLRPGHAEGVSVIVGSEGQRELRVLLRAYEDVAEQEVGEGEATSSVLKSSQTQIADELFRVLRGHHNLVFPNSRRLVETYTDALRQRCEAAGIQNEFWAHHGSLSKQIREEAETALKNRNVPSTAIATSTLELGIDIGSVRTVAQIGPAPGVANLRQRLGRSGRAAGQPQILRAFLAESVVSADSPLSDRLRETLIQLTAQINLLIQGWYEPPSEETLHLSTLIQQLLSLIAQYGGISASHAYGALCANNVFPGLSPAEFACLLKELGVRQVLIQDSTGLLLHGRVGEEMVNHYTFLAAFTGSEEFQVVVDGRPLGTLPIDRPLTSGSFMIFAGRRWEVIECLMREKTIQVRAAVAGKAPTFSGLAGQTHDRVRAEMRAILASEAEIPYLDSEAIILLGQARECYRNLNLERQRLIRWGNELLVLTWAGDRVNDTIAAWLGRRDLKADNDGVMLSIRSDDISAVIDALFDLADSPTISADELLPNGDIPTIEKWEPLLPNQLLRRQYVSRVFDVPGAQRVAQDISDACGEPNAVT